MTETRFWLIRHALVEENARAILYGVMDVALCETTLLEQGPMYRSLARHLPRPAVWLVSPLTRTRRTAEAIFAAGYPRTELIVERRAFLPWQIFARTPTRRAPFVEPDHSRSRSIRRMPLPYDYLVSSFR